MNGRDDYDWELDAYRSWQLAIAEIRRRKVEQGELEPVTDEERKVYGSCRHTNPCRKGSAPGNLTVDPGSRLPASGTS